MVEFNPKYKLRPDEVEDERPGLDDIFGSVGEAMNRSQFGGRAPAQYRGGVQDSLSAARQRLAGLGGTRSSLVRAAAPASAASPVAHANGDVRQMAQAAAAKRGWTGAQWNALADLVQRESGWNPNAKNPTSTAAGLFQFLDSTRANYGISRTSPLQAQIDAGLRYIADRYKTPQAALTHWLAKKPINGKSVGHWY